MTRPTDAELIALLREVAHYAISAQEPIDRRRIAQCLDAADALEAASAEPFAVKVKRISGDTTVVRCLNDYAREQNRDNCNDLLAAVLVAAGVEG